MRPPQPPLAFFLALGAGLLQAEPVHAAGGPLNVELFNEDGDPLNAYNLVVDSNATATSTYAPSAATVIARFCNEGSTTLDNVWGYIGTYTSTASNTPGISPSRDSSDGAFQAEHPALADTCTYAFEHVGTGDASRYIGSLAPGEWPVPVLALYVPSVLRVGRPPVLGRAYLWLGFDVWTTAGGGYSDNETWKMTLRNEISAMANKIEPNPNGRWFNTNADEVLPGDIITSNGILYRFGNINQGFDNDSDFAYDYNAWAQPVGDRLYDASCFRLIRTSGVLTVSRSADKPDMVVNFSERLYFTNPPPMIENCADASFGDGPAFDKDCVNTLVEGSNSISDRVWKDENSNGVQDSGEISITNVSVYLYWDADGDGELDDGDSDLPTDAFGNSYVPSTPTTVTTTISGGNTYLDADFGFMKLGAIGDTIYWDANGDGDVNDGGEMIEFGDMVNEINSLVLSLPSSAPAGGKVNMRFRLYEGHSSPPVISPIGSVENGEVEDYQKDLQPTVVSLASFTATPVDGAIRLDWETGTELDNLGFHLYRAESPAGPLTRLNESLIPCQAPGGVWGASYTYLDQAIVPGLTYYYWLDAVDIHGTSTRHGPASAASTAQSLTPRRVFLPLVCATQRPQDQNSPK